MHLNQAAFVNAASLVAVASARRITAIAVSPFDRDSRFEAYGKDGDITQVRTRLAYRYKMDTVEPVTHPMPNRFDSYDCSAGCPVEAALEQIAGKWKGLIIYHLMEGTLRFSELSRRVKKVTQRSLTKQLRELEADGIVGQHRLSFQRI